MRIIVQSAKATVRNTSPAKLIKGNNPCGVAQEGLDAAVKRYVHPGGGFETISYGIVAQCGSSSRSLSLPIAEEVDLKRMRRAHPGMARLWDLPSEITHRAFGPGDIFHDRTEEDDLALQRAGEELVPELMSGRFDLGLAAAAKGSGQISQSPSFRSLLADYRGPVTTPEVRASYVPQLLYAQAYKFSHFVAPEYPRLAMLARIQGKVELQVTLKPATGEVVDVRAISGHPLLRPSAINAAKQWRFEPNSLDSETLNLTVDFALRCR